MGETCLGVGETCLGVGETCLGVGEAYLDVDEETQHLLLLTEKESNKLTNAASGDSSNE